MRKFFKSVVCFALCAVLAFGLSSCGRKGSSDGGQYGDYHDGYVDGYKDGISSAQKSISFRVDDSFNEIDYENLKERGIFIEDAVAILTNYADGESVDEEDLHNAIWSIHKFYYDAWEIVWEIDDYTID